MLDCPICLSEQSAVDCFVLREQRFYLCQSCGSYFAGETSTAAQTARKFYETVEAKSYSSYFESLRKRQARQVFRQISGLNGTRFIDIGASYGWMMEVAEEEGAEAYGIEPGNTGAGKAWGDRYFLGTLEEYAHHSPQTHRTLMCWHVLEHFDKPESALKDFRHLMDNQSRLVIGVPCASGGAFRTSVYLNRFFGISGPLLSAFFMHNNNFHRFMFSEKGLKILLGRYFEKVSEPHYIESFNFEEVQSRFNGFWTPKIASIVAFFVKLSGITKRDSVYFVCEQPKGN